MFHSHSRSAMTAFLFTLLATDAAFGGIVQVQRAAITTDKATLIQVSKENTDPIADEAKELKSTEASNGPEGSDEGLRESPPEENTMNAEFRARHTKAKQDSANAALSAIGYLVSAAVSVLAKPVVNNLPGYVNNGIVGIISVLNGMATNATLEHNGTLGQNATLSADAKGQNATLSTDAKLNEISRQARQFPAYGPDGVVHVANSWNMNDEINREDFMADDSLLYMSLRQSDPARFSLMEPMLTAIRFLRRTVILQFMATMVVMSMAHLGRIFLMNLPQLLSITGLGRLTPQRIQTAIDEAMPQTEGWETQSMGHLRERAEHLAKQLVEAVARDQCSERAACFVGAYFSQYSYTPSIMRYLRSPEPDLERPDHPVWLAFRDAAEGRIASQSCDELFKC